MKLSNNLKVLIVGLGLLGGSYAKALKKQGFSVKAIDKRAEAIEYALKNGIIDYGTTAIEPDLIAEADLAVIALYPRTFIEWIKENGVYFKKGALITDVTGVKSCIVDEVQSNLPDGVEFIAAHPMAGRELSGVENSDDAIFRQANYIVVPTKKNSDEAVELCCELGRVLGFRDISQLTPTRHDEMIAFLSQLTHCIAVSLMCSNDNPNLEAYTGDSFRDLTRIARINDAMWSELFLANRDALLAEMERFRATFDRMYEGVKNDDRELLREMMRCSTERRKRFDKE